MRSGNHFSSSRIYNDFIVIMKTAIQVLSVQCLSAPNLAEWMFSFSHISFQDFIWSIIPLFVTVKAPSHHHGTKSDTRAFNRTKTEHGYFENELTCKFSYIITFCTFTRDLNLWYSYLHVLGFVIEICLLLTPRV